MYCIPCPQLSAMDKGLWGYEALVGRCGKMEIVQI